MLLAERIVLDKDRYPEWVSYADGHSVLVRNLYNAALFRIRNTFTGWDKASRYDLEEEVFREIRLTKEKYPSLTCRRILSYNALEKMMHATENPDFFAGLPMQTAQAVLKQACGDFSNWIKALNAYKASPKDFTGKPNMPGYKKPGDKMTIPYTNQDCVLYPMTEDGASRGCGLKMPGTKERIFLAHRNGSSGCLKEARLVPFYGSWILFLVLETEDVPLRTDLPYLGGIDFGVNNTIALALNDSYGLICKGGVIKSQVQYFCKRMAELKSWMTQTSDTAALEEQLRQLQMHHANFCLDYCHKVSRLVIDTCLKHKVGTLVLGSNRYWKQKSRMKKKNNQMFELIPLAKLRDMIAYKAQNAGITVILQEESYTSKSDFLMKDDIPVYGQEGGKKPVFSGTRVKGLYKSGAGIIINSDMNGAANILRKHFPDAFRDTEDFSFLQCPVVIRYRELNKCTPVKRIVGVVDPLGGAGH